MNETNLELTLLRKIKTLPNEIIKSIWNYIPQPYLIFLNKEFYKKYHYLIYTLFPRKRYDIDNYLRFIVRNDLNFVLETFMENEKSMLPNKKIEYKKWNYKNYLTYLLDFSKNNNSIKCSYVLKNIISSSPSSKNNKK